MTTSSRTRIGRAALAGALLAVAAAGPARAADLDATPATLGAVYAAAAGGDVIHLQTGDYGTFAGGSKSATVTLVADPGQTATMAVALTGASHLRLQGLTISSAVVEDSQDVDFLADRFTGQATITLGAGAYHAGLRIHASTFDGIDACASCPEGRVTVMGQVGFLPVGVEISGNHFGGGGASDGILVQGGAYGVEIIGNAFADLVQGANTAHVDPIQLDGTRATHIAGNLFTGNDTGIMAPDGAHRELIEHNVFVGRPGGYPWPIVLGSDGGSTVTHNTLVEGACQWDISCGTIRVSDGNAGIASVGTDVSDNVVAAITTENSVLGTEDFNLVTTGGGTGGNDLAGAAVLAGGAAPQSREGFRLAPGSLGTGAADDGTDMGIGDSGYAPPETSIDAGPAARIAQRAATLRFSAEPGASFACRLDGPGPARGTFAPCTSPRVLDGLADGDYVFSVRAVDPGRTPTRPRHSGRSRSRLPPLRRPASRHRTRRRRPRPRPSPPPPPPPPRRRRPRTRGPRSPCAR